MCIREREREREREMNMMTHSMSLHETGRDIIHTNTCRYTEREREREREREKERKKERVMYPRGLRVPEMRRELYTMNIMCC